MTYEVAVIGAGAAGCSAAAEMKMNAIPFVWLSRGREREESGEKILNYLGLPDVSISALRWAFLHHCERLGVRPLKASVVEIRDVGDRFVLSDGAREWAAKSVVLCVGAVSEAEIKKLAGGVSAPGGIVAVKKNGETSVAGIFAAGGCTGKPYGWSKAAGEGFVAARAAAAFCKSDEE